MSEIKHTFQAGRMNKDLDERLVPKGEYRDALNVEVRTSDGGDAGTVQTLYGNKERLSWDNIDYPIDPTVNWGGVNSRFVGSIADGKNDKAFFFVASPQPSLPFKSSEVSAVKLYKDMVVMYDNVSKSIKPVVTDIFRLEYPSSEVMFNDGVQGSATVPYEYIDVSESLGSQLRPGMRGHIYDLPGFSSELDESGEFVIREVKFTDVDGEASRFRVYFTTMVLGVIAGDTAWVFTADKVLNFSTTDTDNTIITGINIVDNLLLWTDNKSEPKKVNIDRCIGDVYGVLESFSLHSRLKIAKPNSPNVLEYAISKTIDPGLKEEHISVIRRAPRTAVKLEMSTFEDGIAMDTIGTVIDQKFTDNDGSPLGVGSEVDVEISGLLNTDPDLEEEISGTIGFQYAAGQVVVLESDENSDSTLSIRATVVSAQWSSASFNGIGLIAFRHTLVINSIDPSVTASNTTWSTIIEQKKPLFEFNLGRFSYRYKYQDGEYSSFAPWSELAFLPGRFDYTSKKGYNLGMVNTVRDLKVTDFVVDDFQRPDDIIEVDILYKDTVSPNVRIVKSVRKNIDPEWNDNSDIGGNSGVVNISSEMMHGTLPSSQILRGWDNVPRFAKAQEVTGNRVVYGNYLQNFSINSSVVVKPGILSTDHLSIDDQDFIGIKSLKSIRKYKVGVVFGDKYGRETPVMGIGGETSGTVVIPSSVSVEKINSSKINQLQAELSWGSSVPDDWMEYYKYYVKETTNEYYNLVLHRWYDAEDGNIWLAFSSADRNKLDEETYITLKNEHGSEAPITDEARYKILSIKNEAPDHIKITEKIIGESLMDDTNSLSNLNDAMIVSLTDSYNDQLAGVDFKGTGWVRIKGVRNNNIELSKWVKIAQMDDTNKRIIPIEPFGDSALLFENFGVEYGDQLIEWSVEVKDNVVENKPEFDGRFFVKIVKDNILSTSILKTTSTGVDYTIIDRFDFGSISTVSLTNPASAAAYQGNYTGDSTDLSAALPSAIASSNFTNTLWNANNNVEGVDTNALFNSFEQYQNCSGDGDEASVSFWASNTYEDNNHWFIDESHQAISVTGGNTPSQADFDNAAMKGLRSDGNVSRIDFSCVHNTKEVSDSAARFKEAMTNGGTLFRFLADPLNNVYIITDNTGIEWKENFHATHYFSCKKCGWWDNAKANCWRAKFTISFVNADGSGPLDTSVWDPRSALQHDGTGSSQIQIIEPTINSGSTLDFKTGNAVWETEPKEDTDTDLYYEATNALPIKLSQKNIESFCPVDTEVKVHRPGAFKNPIWLGSGIMNAGGLTVRSNHRNIISTDTPTTSTSWPRQIGIEDILKFTHKDGSVTEGIVVDHMHPLVTANNLYPRIALVPPIDTVIATYRTSTIFTDIECTMVATPVVVEGCTSVNATNYNPQANQDDGSCEYDPDTILGCTDIEANNYDSNATVDNGSCLYSCGSGSGNTTYIPEIGEMWFDEQSNLGRDGVVITRTFDNDCNASGYIKTDYTHKWDTLHATGTWSGWSNYFSAEGYSGIDEWASFQEANEIYDVLNTDSGYDEAWTPEVQSANTPIWCDDLISYQSQASVFDMSDGTSTLESSSNSHGVFGIIRYNTSPWVIDDAITGERGVQSGLSLSGSAPAGFDTSGNKIYEAISAKNTDGEDYILPAGMFVTHINGSELEYTTTDSEVIDIAAGTYSITFQEVTGYYKLNDNVYNNKTTLPWFNCYSFGNGLESDRIRDDYNAPQIDNGVKVSTVLDSYSEERRSSGMIHSGIYNSTSGVNNLNEFNISESITKDLNPSYGSIQALKTRDTNIVAFCEDKVFKILANKDILYNADGSSNLVSSNKTLGDASAFSGEYGISSNPESLAVDGYRMYFTDKQRNKVLRLSQDGLTPISDIGMTSWFRDNLNHIKSINKQELIGTFDEIKGEYNLSIRNLDNDGSTRPELDTTVSFNEKSKGWSSFKSFVPEVGLSINDEYVTGKIAKLWSHHNDSVKANTFYGESLVASTIDILFNENPGSVKSFLAMNYEGSQAKVNDFVGVIKDGVSYNDGEYYNLKSKAGWYVDSFTTDLQNARIPDFKQKEGKWFNYISGVETTLKTLDTSEFSVQGIGVFATATTPTINKVNLTIRENND